MDVSENSGTSKSSILIGFSIINHQFWGIPIFGNTHMKLKRPDFCWDTFHTKTSTVPSFKRSENPKQITQEPHLSQRRGKVGTFIMDMDSSHHQDDMTLLGVNPYLNLCLPLESWVLATSKLCSLKIPSWIQI